VRIGTGADSFCIDSTEVTNEQYRAYLQATGGVPSGMPGVCTFKTTHLPPSPGWPPADSHLSDPVASVDWCDALAYCLWAGKTLCGKPRGGAHATADMNEPQKSAWFHACSKNGERSYPYGVEYDGSGCNGEGSPASAGVGTFASCEGGYSALFDMSGNLEEWTDSCESDATGADDGCLARGGNFDSTSSELLRCAASSSALQYRKLREPWRGFRCCGS